MSSEILDENMQTCLSKYCELGVPRRRDLQRRSADTVGVPPISREFNSFTPFGGVVEE